MRWICFAIAFALPIGPSEAQDTPPLVPGARVRVITPDGRVVGTLESIDSASLQVRAHSGTVNLATRRITHMDVSAGPGICSPGHRGTCILVGSLVGAGLGVALGAIWGKGSEDAGMAYLMTVPAGVLVGTIVGVFVGPEHWRHAAVPVRVTVTPAASDARGSWRLALRLDL